MQLMPETAAELGVKNSFDPAQNIMGGTQYLSKLLARYRGDTKMALAAYNWGMGNLERAPHRMPPETRNYVQRVQGEYNSLTG
jgi:soluble lytic murein transglycosylase-like protein